MIRTALGYARKGVHVFPCIGKVPAFAGHGVLEATTDADVITEWWGQRPDANIAIATGASSLVVIDLDRKNGVDGVETLRQLEADLSWLPQTLTAETPSGGEHRFFKAPAGEQLRPRAGRVGAMTAPGVDIRAGNSYVVAAPSVICGRAYRWLRRDPVAELPREWVDALRTQQASQVVPAWIPSSIAEGGHVVKWCEGALRGECEKVARAPAGTRNAQLWASAAAMGGLVHTNGVTEGRVLAELWNACAAWPASSRDQSKDRATIERGVAWGMKQPRDLPDLSRHAG